VPVREGCGRFVIERMVEQTLGASVSLAFEAEGLAWRLDSPAMTVLPDDAPPGREA
jgi:hypothetical protein